MRVTLRCTATRPTAARGTPGVAEGGASARGERGAVAHRPPPLGPEHTTFATSASTRCADGGASAGTGAPLAAEPVDEPAALRTSDNLTAPPAMHLATKEPSWGSEARRDGSGAPGGSKGEARLAVAPSTSGRTGGASSSPRGERGERGMPCRGGRARGSSMRGMPRE
eukprot:scaffold99339_cov66-Phaeocystis_antarctica.AAC.6